MEPTSRCRRAGRAPFPVDAVADAVLAETHGEPSYPGTERASRSLLFPVPPPAGHSWEGGNLLAALDDVGARLVAMEIRLAYLRGVRDLAVYAERVR